MIKVHLKDKPGHSFFVKHKDFNAIEINSAGEVCVNLKIFGNYGTYRVTNTLEDLLNQVERTQEEDTK